MRNQMNMNLSRVDMTCEKKKFKIVPCLFFHWFSYDLPELFRMLLV